MPRTGEFIILISPRGKRRLLCPDQDLQTQDGTISLEDLAAAEYGSEVRTSLNIPYRILRPQLYDLIMGVKRQTQIMYPKDMGLVCFKLGVGSERTILEAGSGSGGFTAALSWFAGPGGRIHSFEAREEFHKLARRNLERFGLGKNVSFHHRDIADGFGLDSPEILNKQPADALFLDVRTPWDYLDHARQALVPGAPIAFLLPTADQVGRLLLGLEQGHFAETEVCEILVRPWKAVPDRLRPADRMIAHTGFLVFTRKQEISPDWGKSLNLGTRERKQEAARLARLEDPDPLDGGGGAE